MHNKTTFHFVHLINNVIPKPMYKLTLFVLSSIIFQSCSNKQSQEPAPDRVITDTLAQQFLHKWDLPTAYGVQRVEPTITRPQQQFLPLTNALAVALFRQAPDAENFVINIERDNTIQGKKGTSVFFPAHCFAKNGKEVEGEVVVQLKECYTAKELWQHNLNTNSGSTLYSTKGAVSILAFYEGEAVDLKDGVALAVSFGISQSDSENLQLNFGGRQFDGVMQWKNLSKIEPYALTKVDPPKLFVPELSLAEYLAEKLNYPDEAKRNELSAKVTASIDIDQNGVIRKVIVNSPFKTFRDELETTLYALPAFSPAMKGDETVSCKMAIEVNFDIRQKQQISVFTKERDVVYVMGNNIATNEQVNVSTSRLGWLACQTALSPSMPTAQVVLPSDEHANFKLVMKNKQVVVAAENFGSHVQFSALPLGETATLVGVKVMNGESYFFQQNISLSSQHIVTPIWTKKQVVI